MRTPAASWHRSCCVALVHRADEPLTDAQGRPITYLRLSVNEACNFRCVYCSPTDRDHGVLSAGEIGRLVRIFASLGVRRVRITGGEPTLRKDLPDVVRAVREHVDDVALTTNGARLAPLAPVLRDAGLRAINVSLDTLDAGRLAVVSGARARLADVLDGIDAARDARLALSTNTVVLGGTNDDELAAIVRFAWSRGARPRFLELMPFAGGMHVTVRRMRASLEAEGFLLAPSGTHGWGPARYVQARDPLTAEQGLVGFIGPLSENFCASCNRVRVGATGSLRACLGGMREVPLADLLRGGASDEAIAARIRAALLDKAPAHTMAETPRRRLLPMMRMGG